jgi:hypothetical protein
MASYRIRVGTWDAGDMTSTYNVTGFTVQSDQRHKWVNPVSPSGRWSQYDGQADGLDGTRRFIGKFNGVWVFGALTPLQVQYLRNTIFPSNGVNETVTIVTYDDYLGFICLNLAAHWNDPARTSQAMPGLPILRDLRIDFNEGTLNTGGAFSSGFSSGFDIGGIPA